MARRKKPVRIMLAEFENPHALLEAAKQVRSAGYRRFDCHSPFPIHGMDAATGLGPSRLGWIVIVVGLGGCLGAYLLQMWVHSIAYPLVIAGKPYNSVPAWVPVIFELTVLSSAFAALIGMLAMNQLPRFNHPLFNSARFEKVTDDAFFVSIEARDPTFDDDETREFLESLGAQHVEIVADE